MIRRRFHNTRDGKIGAIDGINLFFGALLDASLGVLDRLRLVDYVQFVVLLAGTVMALRMVSTTGRRRSMVVLLLVYGVLLTALVMVPALKPVGLSDDALHRIVATLAIWVALAIGIELSPVREDAATGSE
jgi:hypothetical protein